MDTRKTPIAKGASPGERGSTAALIARHPERFWGHLGRAYFVARRYVEAIEAFRRITAPDAGHHASLAACYSRLGDAAAAKSEAQATLKRNPDFTVATHSVTLHYKHAADREHHLESPIAAGLPRGTASANA